MSKEWLLQWLLKNKWVIIFMITALLFAVLLLTIGFFRTFLIALLLVAGGFVGHMVDKFGFVWIKTALSVIFRRTK